MNVLTVELVVLMESSQKSKQSGIHMLPRVTWGYKEVLLSISRFSYGSVAGEPDKRVHLMFVFYDFVIHRCIIVWK